MADIQKRTKKTRKQAAKRAASARKDAEKRAKKTRKRAKATAKVTKKAVERTSVATRAKSLAGAAALFAVVAVVAKKLKGGSGDEQRYTSEPDNLPNTPAQPPQAAAPIGAEADKAAAEAS